MSIEQSAATKTSFGSPIAELSPRDRKTAITGYELRHQIEALVAGIAAKKIRHVYSGTGAWTSPDVMCLPTLPQLLMFRQNEVHILLGYGAHEICHQLESDFEIIKTIFADIENPTKEEIRLKHWWNAIEDYRIEKITKTDYPGFARWINALREHSTQRFLDDVQAGRIKAEDLANPYRYGALALTWLGGILNLYPTRTHEQALKCLSPELEDWVRSLDARMMAVQSTTDALDLARELLDELDQNNEEVQQLSTQSNNDNAETSDDTSEDSQSQSSSSGADDEAQDGSEPESDATDGQNADESTGDNDAGEEGTDDDADDAEGDNQNAENGATDHNDLDHGGNGEGSDVEDESEELGEDCSENSAGDQSDNQDGDDASSDHDRSDSGEDADSSSGEAGEEDKSSPQSEDQSGSAAESGDGDEAAQDSQGSGEDDGSDAADQNGQSQSCGTNASNGQPQGQNSQSSTPSSAPQTSKEQREAESDETDLNIDDLMEELAKKTEAEDQVEADCREAAPEAPTSEANDNDDPEANLNEQRRINVQRVQREYAEVKRTIGSAAARSAGVVRRLLMSQDKVKHRQFREEGNLDLSRLVPIVNGHKDVYRDRKVTRAVNSAVSILLDLSYSMGAQRRELCQKASIALDAAITGTSTDLEITGFTGSVYDPWIYQFRRFGQKGQAAAASLGNIMNIRQGGTPVALPLLDAHRRLEAHPAPRKIMIVISDGAAQDWQRARQAHDLLVARGTAVLAIGIETDIIKQWADNYHVIDSVDELPTALTGLVQNLFNTRKAA